MTPEEIADAQKVLEKFNNDDLKTALAYIHYMKEKDFNLLKEVVGVDMTPEELDEYLQYMWTEANRRGIPLQEVQQRIHEIAQLDINTNKQQIKNNAALRELLAEKKKKRNRDNIIVGVLVVSAIALVAYLIYKSKK